MKTGIIIFPGSNCDRDMSVVMKNVFGLEPIRIWHKDTHLPQGLDFIAIPGGFSYGDYLRCGALAAHSNIIPALSEYADKGGYILGVCNGFQILLESGLLPGALMRNRNMHFVCKDVQLRVETTESAFTRAYQHNAVIKIPVAHADGNYYASNQDLDVLNNEKRIAFKYTDVSGMTTERAGFNGSVDNIAGILSENRRILGMMPHPERMAEAALGGIDGRTLFEGLMSQLVSV